MSILKPKQIALLLALLLGQVTTAQENKILKFPNGEKLSFTMVYDDPTILPKYAIGLCFFGFTVTGPSAGTYQFIGEYRFSKKLMVDLRYTLPFFPSEEESGDGTLPDEIDFTSDLTIMGHYPLYSAKKPKLKTTAVAYEGNTVYTGKFYRNLGRTLDMDFGINRLSVPQSETVGEFPSTDSNSTNTTKYYAANGKHFNLNLGLSFFRSQSYKMITQGITRRYLRTSRLYGYLSYSLIADYDYYINDNSFSGIARKVSKPSGISEINKVGWRLGYQNEAYFKNSSWGYFMGFEFGKRSHFKALNGSGNVTDSFIMAHFGLKFGKI